MGLAFLCVYVLRFRWAKLGSASCEWALPAVLRRSLLCVTAARSLAARALSGGISSSLVTPAVPLG